MGSEPDGRRKTLEIVIVAASLVDHCEYAALMQGWMEDGEINWKFMDIRPERLGLSESGNVFG